MNNDYMKTNSSMGESGRADGWPMENISPEVAERDRRKKEMTGGIKSRIEVYICGCIERDDAEGDSGFSSSWLHCAEHSLERSYPPPTHKGYTESKTLYIYQKIPGVWGGDDTRLDLFHKGEKMTG